MILQSQGKGFVEFESPDSVKKGEKHFEENEIILRERRIKFQKSNTVLKFEQGSDGNPVKVSKEHRDST